jgi:DNA-binding response OmpR family regulator
MQKIIILDDNNDILEAVSLVLKRKSMDVVALNEPALLEEYIPRNEPVLLLMDIFIGRYDGRGICRMLKNNPLFNKLSIILFSAQTYTSESVQESGADAMLNKPFSTQTLISVIDRLVSNQH